MRQKVDLLMGFFFVDSMLLHEVRLINTAEEAAAPGSGRKSVIVRGGMVGGGRRNEAEGGLFAGGWLPLNLKPNQTKPKTNLLNGNLRYGSDAII
eukprot:scaffold10238_cov142-Skeletonema_marinoi.AAC.2